MQQSVETVVALCFILASCAAWWFVVHRWRRGTPPLPQEAHPEVRWDFADVLMVLMIFLLASSGSAYFFQGAAETARASSDVNTGAGATDKENSTAGTSEHPVLQLVVQSRSVKILVLAFLVVAVIVPLGEEFLFRLMMLAWLAKQETQFRQRVSGRWRLGVAPLLLVSLMFALMHFRSVDKPLEVDALVRMIQVNGARHLATIILSVAYLRIRYRATLADFGFSPRCFGRDLKVAAVGFLIVVIPLLFLQYTLKSVLPSGAAPDPIPLFFLALVFGFMYLRTGRITSCVLLHVFINAFSLLSALALAHFGGAFVP